MDRKKLERAETRALEKATKREVSGGGKVEKKRTENLSATASQASNRLLENAGETAMDVHLFSVDVSIGTKQLLCGADVTLAYGRRYGLVGRNGAGKSTFLKMISSGQLKIPSNMSMLSVEQEVEGDETEVLAAVLQSDTRRVNLLEREKELHKLTSEYVKIIIME